MIKKKKTVIDFDRSSTAYFKEIGAFKPLSHEEEFTLWEQYKKNNDLKARDKLIHSNLRFVASVAKHYQGMGLSYSDLIAEGNIGLMKALDRFEYERGLKTISYSVWWIRQSILEALKERNNLKAEELPQDFEKQVSDDDDTSPLVPLEYISEDNFLEQQEIGIKKAINELSDCLTPRERKIIQEYFGIGQKDGMTLEEIGQQLGLTKERVRQIKEKALKKMRAEALLSSVTEDSYR